MSEEIPELVDITGPTHVEVLLREDRSVLWINVDGICRLRICKIQNFVFNDEKYPGE
jgi:hypothetical protein